MDSNHRMPESESGALPLGDGASVTDFSATRQASRAERLLWKVQPRSSWPWMAARKTSWRSLARTPAGAKFTATPIKADRKKSTLGELGRATCLVQTDLLALHRTRIAGHESGAAQGCLQGFVVLDQRAGDAEADRAGLAGDAATRNVDLDVELVGHLGQFERLAHDHARGFAAEELVQRLAVDNDRAAALAQEHACGGGLAAAGAGILLQGRHDQISNALGCCAVCGCSVPRYTLSLRNIARPSGFFGNIPLTANSITRSGCVASRSLRLVVLRLPTYPVKRWYCLSTSLLPVSATYPAWTTTM